MVVWGGEVDGVDSEYGSGAVFEYSLGTGWVRHAAASDEDDRGGRGGRAWHGACLVDGKVAIYGGLDAEGGSPAAGARVLDLGSGTPTWTRPELAARPALRTGACLCRVADASGDDAVLVVGGSRGGRKGGLVTPTVDALGPPFGAKKRLQATGPAPPPCAVGSAVVVEGGDALVVLGTLKRVSLMRRGDDGTWAWEEPFVVGPAPAPRTKHAAALLPDGTSILVHGGLADDGGGALQDAHVLCTRLWEWSPAPKDVAKAFGHRYGHTLALVDDADTQQPVLLAFGGVDKRGKKLAKLASIRDSAGIFAVGRALGQMPQTDSISY